MNFAHTAATANPTPRERLETAAQTFRFVPNLSGVLAERSIAPKARVVGTMSPTVPYPVRCSEIWGGNGTAAYEGIAMFAESPVTRHLRWQDGDGKHDRHVRSSFWSPRVPGTPVVPCVAPGPAAPLSRRPETIRKQPGVARRA